MEQTLTCWKDIASYLGKGVRTVQRWEEQDGLPIRRKLDKHEKQPVFALASEIDAWVRARHPRSMEEFLPNDELEALRREVHELRTRLETCEAEELKRTARSQALGEAPMSAMVRQLIQESSDIRASSRKLRAECGATRSAFHLTLNEYRRVAALSKN